MEGFIEFSLAPGSSYFDPSDEMDMLNLGLLLQLFPAQLPFVPFTIRYVPPEPEE